MSSQPLSPSELIFPSAHTSLNSTLSNLRRSDLCISNRLHSILHDAHFVSNVASAYQLPLIANERCGSWYVSPSDKAGSGYFKSTDGHHGQWSFSLRRLNLQVLEIVGRDGGCVIVDSTRRGKSMPDALSKTVPIWIAVLNRLLFPEISEASDLQTPRDVVSRSENSRIQERLAESVAQAETLHLDKESLRIMLRGKPMEPFWVTPDTAPPASFLVRTDRNTVVLCTASGRTSATSSVSGYVQGAADDSESWALGLDAQTFWRHRKELLSTSEDELPGMIQSLVADTQSQSILRRPVHIKPTQGIWICSNTAAEVHFEDFDFVISCSENPIDALVQKMKSRYIHIACTSGKVGSRQLRIQLSKLVPSLGLLSSSSKALVACQTGRDLAIGVALTIICLCCDQAGNLLAPNSPDKRMILSKAEIKHRLSWIMVSMPDAAPSRATLQSVNAFLLG